VESGRETERVALERNEQVKGNHVKSNDECGNGVKVRWVAIVGAFSVLVAGLAFGSAYAALPARVTALEVRMEVLTKELKDGRSERLIFQGETGANLARIETKLDILLEQKRKVTP